MRDYLSFHHQASPFPTCWFFALGQIPPKVSLEA
uniref:Uncharacterized protein n=1 Tax=Arundo donax TaxID=35708 RepID=A0A0A9EDA9_ARUDO